MTSFSAVLFDCDGVLIDSEIIACGVMVEHFRSCGYDITLEDFLVRFMGKNFRRICDEVAAESGVDIAGSFDVAAYKAEQYAAFEKHLKPVEGIADFLKSLQLPIAVASGSEMARLYLTLDITGLRSFFGAHIYSADMVENGKPAPDIFLHAAAQLCVAPVSCLVIEDGIHGIHGAKAAGMEVWAYLGGSHMSPRVRQDVLAAGPDRHFETIADLAAAFAQRQSNALNNNAFVA